VERKLRKDVLQIVQLFPCHFLPMVPEVLNICVLGVMLFWVFPIFYRFPNRIIFPHKTKNEFFKGLIQHFLEFGFKSVVCSVIYSSAVWCVSSLTDCSVSSLFGY
jgi:hypothetical protein